MTTVINFVTRSEAAAMLCCSPKTLANWAASGRGPKYYRPGNRTLYDPADVTAFAKSNGLTIQAVQPNASVGRKRGRPPKYAKN